MANNEDERVIFAHEFELEENYLKEVERQVRQISDLDKKLKFLYIHAVTHDSWELFSQAVLAKYLDGSLVVKKND